MIRSIKVKAWLTLLAVLWAAFSLMPITERPFEVFIRTRAKAHKEEFQTLLDKAQERVVQNKERTLFLALMALGEEEKIDYSKFFPDLKLADIKNLKRRNKVLLHHLLKEPQSVFKQGLDLKGGVSFSLQINPKALEGKNDWEKRQLMQKAIDVITTRIDALGVAEPIIRPKGFNYIEVQLPGLTVEDNPDVVRSLKKPAKLEFRLVNDAISPYTKEVPVGYERLTMEHEDPESGEVHETPLLVKKLPELTGQFIKSAMPVIDPYGKYEISLRMTPEGAHRFGQITQRNLHKRLAIVLDGKPYSAPVIQSEISSGQASISGRFTQREAIELSNVLNNPLEFELSLVEMYEVGPSLAHDAKKIAFQGAWVGTFIVMLFMFYYYRGVGLAGVLTLCLNFLLILGAWGSIGATITMPSITALALTFGMAVDANILILERIREEMRMGKDLVTATALGHEKAFVTILDSNLTTLLTACLLIWLGTGPVKGFGVTLAIGIVTTMFSVLVFNRALIEWLVTFGVIKVKAKSAWSKINLNFLKCKKVAFSLSFLLLVVGIVSVGIKGKKIFSIDFLGGDEILLQYGTPLEGQAIQAVASKEGLGEVNSVYQKYIGDKKTLNLLKIQTETEKGIAMFHGLQKAFPGANLQLVAQNKIGASVSSEVQLNALLSVLAALLGILIYVALRFEFGYGFGAVVALIHDTLITIGLYVFLGHQFTAPMVAAVLMVIGYSINDTIVVFDRIREELSLNPHASLFDIINLSINKTLTRTLLTSGTTLVPAAVMFFYCSGVVSDYALVFLIGVLTGTFSSIFIASPLFFWWHKGDRRRVEAHQDSMPVYDWMK